MTAKQELIWKWVIWSLVGLFAVEVGVFIAMGFHFFS
jgi:hypothetical protein